MSATKLGRPRALEFKPEQFETLCKIQCTVEEIIAVFHISRDTLRRYVLEHYGTPFAQVYKEFSDQGKISVRRKVYNEVMKDDPSPSIFNHGTDRILGAVKSDSELKIHLQVPAIIEKLDGTQITLGTLNEYERITEDTDQDNS